MNTPVLKSGKLAIRAFERKDLETFALYRSQEIVFRYQSWSNYCLQDALQLFENTNYSIFGVEGN